MNKREYELNLIEEFMSSGKSKKCRDGVAKGTNPFPTTSTRSKKCMTYNTTSAPKMRLMNYESDYNIPVPYNGSKMVVGKY